MTFRGAAATCLLGGLIALSCGSDPSLGTLRAAIVIDRAVFTVVREFRIVVLSAQDSQGQPVGCVDIPTSYRLGDGRLRALASASLNWGGQTSEAQKRFYVPADQQLLIVVEGWASGQVVARGCSEGHRFVSDQEYAVEIDARATAGAACADAAQCEPAQTCSLEFPLGYCLVQGCAAGGIVSDSACPPGSVCIDNAAGGLCLQSCLAPADCRTSYLCESRRVVGAENACANVCAPFEWNIATKCIN